jgi:hypothetical protein
MNLINKKHYAPIAIVFIFLSSLIIFADKFLKKNGFDTEVLMIANIFLFMLSLIGFILQRKGLQSPNPNVFVRSVYASMIFKMFICMIAVLIYVFLFRNKINRSGIFTAMGMYIIYTVAEVSALMRAARKKTNA